jgi:hypothetical protein
VLASLIIGGALLMAIVAASGWGAVVLPANARIAVHYGSENHQYLVSKRAGLLIWPALGVIMYGALGGIVASSLAAGWVRGRGGTAAELIVTPVGRGARTIWMSGRGIRRR